MTLDEVLTQQYMDRMYPRPEPAPEADPTAMATEMAAGTEPEGATPMSLRQFAETAADAPAGVLKGTAQQFFGTAGDIELLGRAVDAAIPSLQPGQVTLFPVVNAVRQLAGMPANALERFVEGLEANTILPTTEDIKKWFDTNIGTLVPEGADPRRVEAAKTAEFTGEVAGFGGALKAAAEVAPEVVRGARQIGAEMATTPPVGSIGGADISYRGFHSAPTRDFGAQLHQLDQIFPDDIYSPQAAQLYGHFGRNDPMDRQTIKLAQSLRNKPDADVTIYRAVPKNLNVQDINPGDWVTINKNYAKEHGESVLRGNYKILQKQVKAQDIWTNADSIHEYGYDPN